MVVCLVWDVSVLFRLFGMDRLLNCVLMYVPLVLFRLWSYQIVSLVLKSPTIIAYGMLRTLAVAKLVKVGDVVSWYCR